ncbi:MAG: hypothetical protein ACM3SR_19055 [Ignavibacteriales bacterium]
MDTRAPYGGLIKDEESEMNRKLRFFLIIFLYLPLLWVATSYEDDEDLDYKSENRNETKSLLSVLKSDVVRVLRTVKDPQCWRSNPDDPQREILKGVDCSTRLRIMDKDKPIRKCIGMLILKHRARDGDLTFDVLPDEEYKYLINPINVRKMKGGLHCEIVPDGRAKFQEIFNGMGLKSIVEVEGVWVKHKNHRNWRELHPVTSLKLLKK